LVGISHEKRVESSIVDFSLLYSPSDLTDSV